MCFSECLLLNVFFARSGE
jgi:HTH-type transcriptional regulator/antitoxin HigA